MQSVMLDQHSEEVVGSHAGVVGTVVLKSVGNETRDRGKVKEFWEYLFKISRLLVLVVGNR